MRQKLSWLVIGIGAIAAASIGNSLDWGPSPRLAMAQEPVDPETLPRTNVKSEQSFGGGVPNPGNSNPPEVRGRKPRRAGLPALAGAAPTKGYRPSTRTVAREVTENGQTRIVYETVTVMVPDTNAGKKEELNAAIRILVQRYQPTEDAESRQKIEDGLSKALSELFDLQQAEREEQLKPMEERAKKLRETLNKRAALRDDLIQLRLKVLLQDAEGLGWGTDDEFLPRTMSFDASREMSAPEYGTTTPMPVDVYNIPATGASRRSASPTLPPPKAKIFQEQPPEVDPSP